MVMQADTQDWMTGDMQRLTWALLDGAKVAIHEMGWTGMQWIWD
jgi:hypothetical protein